MGVSFSRLLQNIRPYRGTALLALLVLMASGYVACSGEDRSFTGTGTGSSDSSNSDGTQSDSPTDNGSDSVAPDDTSDDTTVDDSPTSGG
jgi:hypothetical protein